MIASGDSACCTDGDGGPPCPGPAAGGWADTPDAAEAIASSVSSPMRIIIETIHPSPRPPTARRVRLDP